MEGYLQVDATIGCRRRVRPTRKSVGLAEERRTQVSDRRGEIDVVKNVPAGNAECQIIAIVRRIAAKHPAAAISATSWPWAAGATSKRAGTKSTTGCHWFLFRAQTKWLAQAHIQREAPRARQRIDGNDGFAQLGNEIK